MPYGDALYQSANRTARTMPWLGVMGIMGKPLAEGALGGLGWGTEAIKQAAHGNMIDPGPSAYNMMNVMGMGGPAAGLTSGGMKAAPMLSAPKVWYHGSNRIDRVVDSGKIDPKRATSGPSSYFTDSPELASKYAEGKPDTSLMDTGNAADYFTVSPKSLGTRERNPISVERSWWRLTPEQRTDIADRAKRIGWENMDNADGPLTLHPEGTFATLSGPEHWEWTVKENRGNVLAALRDHWLDSGTLIGNEPELQKVFELAGYPHKISQETAPWVTAPGVLPAHLDFKRPLDTTNSETLKNQVIPSLREAFKRDRTRRKYEASPFSWDKDTRYTPKEWLAQLEADVAKGENSFVWTSIPDKVSDQLRRLGYDGIFDTGGKMGGEGHTVAIPLAKGTVKSSITGETLYSGGKGAGLLSAGISAAAEGKKKRGVLGR
jgi:hypothetical protein